MSEPLHLQDHTWLSRREHLMHSFENRPVPGLVFNGAINLKAAGAAAAAAFLAVGVVFPLLLLLGPDSWPAAVSLMVSVVAVVPAVGAGVYMLWRKRNMPAWLSNQLSWLRQPRRIHTPQPGGPEPDQFTYAVILWRPVDPGWKARLLLARSHIAHTASRRR